MSFEDIQTIIKTQSSGYILINTLPLNIQHCLIPHTVSANNEEHYLNEIIDQGIKTQIIIYGKNSNDDTVEEKYKQLVKLGFDPYLYLGGMFEWLMLQDIYGKEQFPTTSRELDILKYKPTQLISNLKLLTY